MIGPGFDSPRLHQNITTMDRTLISTAVALRELKCESLQTGELRRMMQAKMYLAQDIGLLTGYGFSWHITGPYSTELMEIAVSIVLEGYREIEMLYLKRPYSDMIVKVNALEHEPNLHNLKIAIPDWYCLLAQIAYCYNHGYNSEEDIIEKIKKISQTFTDDQTKAAIKSYMIFKNC